MSFKQYTFTGLSTAGAISVTGLAVGDRVVSVLGQSRGPEAAVRTLEGPDPDSNNEANDGRRIERVPGGWMVLNAEAHRDMVTRAVRRERTRETVAKFRAKRACNADVTQSVSVSDSVSDPLPTEEVGANAPPAPKPKRATRIPDGWEPTPDLIEYAKKNLPNVDVDKLREAFTDYWAAAAGERARKADWNATWRTWVRRSSDNYPMEAKRPEFTSGQIRYDANGRVIHA